SATTTFNAVAQGNTTLTASASGYSTPAQDASLTANVTMSGIVTPSVTVGKNLEAPVSVTLNGAASAPNTPVTVTSSSPGTMLLSTTGTDGGFATITLNIPYAGLTHVPTFYVYGLANTGTATYTVAIPGFPSASGTVTLQPSGVILFGPSGPGQVNFTTSTAAANSTITLYSALLDPSNNYVQPMALAGNQTVTVNVTSANASIGTITSSPVTIAAATDSITTQFQPTGVGSSLISVSVPAGYNTPNQDTSVTAVVAQPGIAVSTNVTVGINLEAGGLVSEPNRYWIDLNPGDHPGRQYIDNLLFDRACFFRIGDIYRQCDGIWQPQRNCKHGAFGSGHRRTEWIGGTVLLCQHRCGRNAAHRIPGATQSAEQRLRHPAAARWQPRSHCNPERFKSGRRQPAHNGHHSGRIQHGGCAIHAAYDRLSDSLCGDPGRLHNLREQHDSRSERRAVTGEGRSSPWWPAP
ncbi:MAG: hypothetical protein ABSH09_36615, partial [Bryobacteraceae bacterium]